MKPKYYPHITILGAATIIVVPLCCVLSLPYLSGGSDAEITLNDSYVAHQNPSASTLPMPDDVLSSTEPDTASPRTPSSTGTTRVAMLPDTTSEAKTLAARPTERAAPAKPLPAAAFLAPRPASVAQDVSLSHVDNSSVRPVLHEEDVPIPMAVTAPIDSHNRGATVAVAVDNQVTNDVADPQDAEREALDREMDQVLAQKTSTHAPSHFDSTGHLAMVAPRSAKIAGSDSRTGKRQQNDDRRNAATPRGTVVRPGTESPMTDSESWPVDDGGFGTKPEPVLEDIILQQPLENRRVDRVEPVVAVTRARGWPIALVRSDLPDDHWWVQQMVGTRGNAFAARVNFGNDESIPGSVYHMVIVFLDSPDEVRRFRIAKQFKELPEGTRRTREFTFVRR